MLAMSLPSTGISTDRSYQQLPKKSGRPAIVRGSFDLPSVEILAFKVKDDLLPLTSLTESPESTLRSVTVISIVCIYAALVSDEQKTIVNEFFSQIHVFASIILPIPPKFLNGSAQILLPIPGGMWPRG